MFAIECYITVSNKTDSYVRLQLAPPYLADVDTVVYRPRCLEALHHALLKSFGQPVHPDKVLQILGAGVVEGAARVHPLDDGGHVTEDHSVH